MKENIEFKLNEIIVSLRAEYYETSQEELARRMGMGLCIKSPLKKKKHIFEDEYIKQQLLQLLKNPDTDKEIAIALAKDMLNGFQLMFRAQDGYEKDICISRLCSYIQ